MKDYDKIHGVWERAHLAGSPIKYVRNKCVFRELERLVPGNTLDAGCGTGEYSIFLSKIGHTVTSFDPSPFAIKIFRERVDREFVISMEENTIENFYSSIEYDNIVSIEVIEHIKFDQAAICKLYSLLKKGGMMVISTPAKPFLFSDGDRVSGHYRRYSYAGFRKMLTCAGFNYINIKSYGFPALFIYLFIKKLFLDRILINKYSKTFSENERINFFYKYYSHILTIDQLNLSHLGVGYVAICKK